MTEKERNKRLFLLLKKLYLDQELNAIELIGTMVENDTPSIKMTFEIMKNNSHLYKVHKTNLDEENR